MVVIRTPVQVSTDSVTFEVLGANGQAMADGGRVGAKRPVHRAERTIEVAAFNAGVVVEPLEVAQVGSGRCGSGVQVRGAMPGDLQPMRGGDCRSLQPASDSTATRRVCLKAVDGARRAHALEILGVIAVFA